MAAFLERPSRVESRLSWLATPWASFSQPVRPLRLPPGLHVIGVAGATLGGSGATPVAIELCKRLGARGIPVAYVAHAYGAGSRSSSSARRVRLDMESCDEARLAARHLESQRVAVFVAGRRQAALDAASRELPPGAVVILDGALQATPQRLAESVLVVDAELPWGSGSCPPLGDLRASRARLMTADSVIALDRGGAVHEDLLGRARLGSRRLAFLRSAQTAERRSLEWLAQQDFELLLAVARPERIVQQLLRHGARARRLGTAADHAGLEALLTPKKSSNAEYWVCTEKCWEATLGRQPERAKRWASRVWILEERLELPATWLEALSARFAEPSRPVRASDRFDDSQRTGQGC